VAVLFSLVAQPVAGIAPATAQLRPAGSTAASGNGCDNPPGTCAINQTTGCPDAGDLKAPAGQHCVPIPATLDVIITPVGKACVGNDYREVQLPPTIDAYEAVWINQYGSRWWSSPGTTWPETITGEGGVKFDVPKGSAAWSVGGGASAAGDCPPPPGGLQVMAWGISYKWAVSGTITQSGSGEAAPRINVEGDCTGGGGTTTTNEQGQYEFLVRPGPCTVTPQLINGLKASPQSRSFDVESNVDHVDFVVPCGAVPPPPSGTSNGRFQADAASSPSASAADCLQVFIKIVGPIANVGTRSGLSVDDYMPSDGRMNFTKLIGTAAKATPLVAKGEAGQQCVSGCANILITVIDKVTHKPATDAKVNVALGQIDTAESPSLDQQGTQFLCQQTDDFEHPRCGTSLDGLTLDDQGEVRVLYWAPGELVKAHTELFAQACTPSACLLKRAKSKITVYPYRIYNYQGELSPDIVYDLIYMYYEKGAFEVASKLFEHGLEAAVDGWVERLGVESEAVEVALGPLGFFYAFSAIELAHTVSEVLEKLGLLGAFFSASGLSGAGLYGTGSPPGSAFDKSLSFGDVLGFDNVLSPGDALGFDNLVLSGGPTPTRGRGGAVVLVDRPPAGWLWELAKQLYNQAPYHPNTPEDLEVLKPLGPLSVSVYEASYCSQGADCGPGYGSFPSPNIRTDLCIHISQLAIAPSADNSFPNPVCGIYYDAPIWEASQAGLDQKLGHPHALDTSLP
jgi:hypothetical protein